MIETEIRPATKPIETVTPLTLEEAIKLGRLTHKPARGRWIGKVRQDACVLGSALVALGYEKRPQTHYLYSIFNTRFGLTRQEMRTITENYDRGLWDDDSAIRWVNAGKPKAIRKFDRQ